MIETLAIVAACMAGVALGAAGLMLVGAYKLIRSLVAEIGVLVDRVRLFEVSQKDAPAARLGAKFAPPVPPTHPDALIQRDSRAQRALSEIQRTLEERRKRDEQAVQQTKAAQESKLPKKGIKLRPADVAAGTAKKETENAN